MKKELPTWELFAYYIFNVLTFGALWLYKIVIKKAIIEANKRK